MSTSARSVLVGLVGLAWVSIAGAASFPIPQMAVFLVKTFDLVW